MLFIIISSNKVDNIISAEGRNYTTKYLNHHKIAMKRKTYQQEISFINKVQLRLLNVSKIMKSIPKHKSIETKKIYELEDGDCFTRSKVIEKNLRFSDFRTRHVSIYSVEKSTSKFLTFILPKIPSHTITEMCTQKGWIAIDKNKTYMSIKEIQKQKNLTWEVLPEEIIFNSEFILIYRLHSRHGKFYSHFLPFLDIEWSEFIFNFTERAN